MKLRYPKTLRLAAALLAAGAIFTACSDEIVNKPPTTLPAGLGREALVAYGETGTTYSQKTWETSAYRYQGYLLEPNDELLAARDFPASEQAPIALRTAGALLDGYDDLHAEAIEAWRELATKYPKHALAPDALVDIAKRHAADGDDAKAIEAYGEVVKAYPESARWNQARQGIADLRFARIERAGFLKDWPGVRTAAQEFIDAHPGDEHSGAGKRHLTGLDLENHSGLVARSQPLAQPLPQP